MESKRRLRLYYDEEGPPASKYVINLVRNLRKKGYSVVYRSRYYFKKENNLILKGMFGKKTLMCKEVGSIVYKLGEEAIRNAYLSN